MTNRRALHYVFKVGNRKDTIKFYTEVLEMKVLRHEEFEEGCKATCNGPYDGKWSKTMVGYGPEENHFVVELTYNYGVKSYKLGNSFLGMAIASKKAIENVRNLKYPMEEERRFKSVEAPGGYKHLLTDMYFPGRKDPVLKVALASSNLQATKDYWHGLLGMKIYENMDHSVTVGYESGETLLEFKPISEPIDHAEAFGRIAFSCPTSELAEIEDSVKKAGHKILTPLVGLDTPGKATVHVVILADPDGHEICFVGDEAFRELSHVDPKAEDLLKEAISSDKSDEWFAKKTSKNTV